MVSNAVFENDRSASAAVNGLYAKMVEAADRSYFRAAKVLLNLTGLLSDELDNRSAESDPTEFFLNSVTVTNQYVYDLWTGLYKYVYTSTAIIENLNNSSGVSNDVKNNLIGQAKFVRAFCNFYLMNLLEKFHLLKPPIMKSIPNCPVNQ